MDQIEFLDSFVSLFGLKGINDYESRIYSSQYTNIDNILSDINSKIPIIKALFNVSKLQLSRTNYKVETMSVAFGMLKNLLRQANINYDLFKSNGKSYLQLLPPNNYLREYIQLKMENIVTLPKLDVTKQTLADSTPIDIYELLKQYPPQEINFFIKDEGFSLKEPTKVLEVMIKHNLACVKYNYPIIQQPIDTIFYHTTLNKYYARINIFPFSDIINNLQVKIFKDNLYQNIIDSQFIRMSNGLEIYDMDNYIPTIFHGFELIVVFNDLFNPKEFYKYQYTLGFEGITQVNSLRDNFNNHTTKIGTLIYNYKDYSHPSIFFNTHKIIIYSTNLHIPLYNDHKFNIYNIDCKFSNGSGSIFVAVYIADNLNGPLLDHNDCGKFKSWTNEYPFPSSYFLENNLQLGIYTTRTLKDNEYFIVSYETTTKDIINNNKVIKSLQTSTGQRVNIQNGTATIISN